MTLDLQKGMSLNLTKKGNEKFKIALRWDANDVGEAIDVDFQHLCLWIKRVKKAFRCMSKTFLGYNVSQKGVCHGRK